MSSQQQQQQQQQQKPGSGRSMEILMGILLLGAIGYVVFAYMNRDESPPLANTGGDGNDTGGGGGGDSGNTKTTGATTTSAAIDANMYFLFSFIATPPLMALAANIFRKLRWYMIAITFVLLAGSFASIFYMKRLGFRYYAAWLLSLFLTLVILVLGSPKRRRKVESTVKKVVTQEIIPEAERVESAVEEAGAETEAKVDTSKIKYGELNKREFGVRGEKL